MLRLFQRLLTLLVCLAVPTSVLATPTPTHAVPAPKISLTQGGAATYAYLSSAQWTAGVLVGKARVRALNGPATKMNYRKMKTVFGTTNKTRVDWRRQMAASFRQFGGRIVYISNAENKLVEKRRKQLFKGKKITQRASFTTDVSLRKPIPCEGKNQYVIGKGWVDHYMDSCQSKNLQDAYGICIGSQTAGAAWVAGGTGVWQGAIPGSVAALYCTWQKFWLDRAVDGSDIRAIIVRTWKQEAYMPYPNQVKYSIRYETRSQ